MPGDQDVPAESIEAGSYTANMLLGSSPGAAFSSYRSSLIDCAQTGFARPLTHREMEKLVNLYMQEGFAPAKMCIRDRAG